MAKIATLVEPFTSLDAAVWDSWGTTSIVSGALDVPANAGYDSGAETVAAWDLTSSSIYWKLVQRPATDAEGIMYVQDSVTPANNEAGFDITSTTLLLHYKNGGTTSDTTITYNATSHAWLRLRHDGATLYWETAPDSSGAPGTWTVRRSIAAPSWCSSVHMLFTAGRSGTSSPSLQVDGVNTTAGGTGSGGGGTSIPDTPSVVNPGPSGAFNWCGLNWNKRSGSGAPAASGSWSTANVIVNGDGTITLQRTSNNSAEMESTAGGYGYGQYWLVTSRAGGFASLPSGAVFGGLFTYDNASSPASHREIDLCETSDWGSGTVHLEPGYFTPDGVSHVLAELIPRNEDVQTHCLTWEPGKLTFRHWSGTDVSVAPFSTETTTSQVAVPGNETVLVNVWNFSGNPTFSVKLLHFAFVPAGYSPPPPPSVAVSKVTQAPIDAVTGAAHTAPSLPYEATGTATAAVSAIATGNYAVIGQAGSVSVLPFEAAGRVTVAVSRVLLLPYEAAGSTGTPPPVTPPPVTPPELSGRTNVRVISEIPPTRVHLLASTPTGRKVRWGHDERSPERTFQGLTYSSVAPGGYDTCDCTLARDPSVDYPDLERLTTLQVIGAGGDVVGEYRLERTPMTSGDQMQISPSAVGWQNALEDDKGCSFIGIDRDVTAWQDATSQLKAEQYLTGWNPGAGSMEVERGGTVLNEGSTDFRFIYPAALKLAIETISQDKGTRYPPFPTAAVDRGVWDSTATYAVNDVVSYFDGFNNLSYMRRVAGGPSVTPPPLDGGNWQLRLALFPVAIAQAMYDAGAGNRIGLVRGNIGENDFSQPQTAYGAYVGDWQHALSLEQDFRVALDNSTGAMGSGGDFPDTWAVDNARRYAFLRLHFEELATLLDPADGAPYVITGTNPKGWRVSYRYLRVYGNHGITIRQPTEDDYNAAVAAGHFSALQGLWEYQELNEGLLASDVAKYIVDTFVPALRALPENIERSTFLIPQLAFKDKTTPGDMLRQTLRFGYPPVDWFVWSDRRFYLHRRGGGRRWRARAGPAKLSETGPAVDRLWNHISVSFTDSSGEAKLVGPPGSNADYQSPYLVDLDPDNPANQLGVSRQDVLTMGTGDSTSAITIGQIFLQQARALDRSGSATIVGYVLDESGIAHPYNAIRAGDEIQFTDAADTSFRRISKATHNDDQRSCQVDLDAPPEGLEGLLERLNVGLVSLGIS